MKNANETGSGDDTRKNDEQDILSTESGSTDDDDDVDDVDEKVGDDAVKDDEQVIMSTESGSTDGDDDDMDDVDKEVGDDDMSSPQPLDDHEANVEEEQQDLRSRMSSGEEYGLPSGWQVEERRRLSGKLKGRFDKYYYEPGTNRKFRSMKELKQHLGIEDSEPSRKKVKKGIEDQVEFQAGSSSTSKRGRRRGRRGGTRGRGRGKGCRPLSKPVLRTFAKGTTSTIPAPMNHPDHDLPPHHQVVFVAKSNDNENNDDNGQ